MIPVRDTIPTRNPPVATWVLIGANCLVFLYELSLPQARDYLHHRLAESGCVFNRRERDEAKTASVKPSVLNLN